jgi:hypothetical protein
MKMVLFELIETLHVSQINCSFNKCYLKWFLLYGAVSHYFYSIIFYFDTCSKLMALIIFLSLIVFNYLDCKLEPCKLCYSKIKKLLCIL